MLRLKNLNKSYEKCQKNSNVLDNISISFRKNEFVSILGKSGSGKTTLLNIIGGLDKYNSGDMFVNENSTKHFKSKDWEKYRNEKVGFIFQNYNLIPHQTILENVCLPLALAGVKRKKRIQRGIEILSKVGLGDRVYDKPKKLSGGEQQRVAIARALVNEPEILLADEPTGALDSKTSIQIMDLIKKISKVKLVIMVTHDSELAEKYSTRIVKIKDGKINYDSNPYSSLGDVNETYKSITKKKHLMSFFTSLFLSVKALLSKRKRTLLTSIAGAIGIIGLSSVLALTNGMNNYVDTLEEDLLSAYPVTVSDDAYDLSTVSTDLWSIVEEAISTGDNTSDDSAIVDSIIKSLIWRIEYTTYPNEISDNYVEYVKEMPDSYYQSIGYTNSLYMKNALYTDFAGYSESDESTSEVQSISSITKNFESFFGEYKKTKTYGDQVFSLVDSINPFPASDEYIQNQYSIVRGRFPENKDEMVLVLSSDNEISDLILAQMGYYSEEEYLDLAYGNSDTDYEYSYDDLMSKKFYFATSSQMYNQESDDSFTYNNTFDSSNLEEVDVVGIIEPNDNISYGCLDSGFYYTSDLEDYMIESTLNDTSGIYDYLLENDSIDTITYDYQYYSLTSSSYVEETGIVTGRSTYEDDPCLTLRDIGGNTTPNNIYIYPTDFETKDEVTDYLNYWNSSTYIELSDGTGIAQSEKEAIYYTDNASIIVNVLTNLVETFSIAMIVFTSLSILVSCFMIAIMTYVSVIERTKEIGVIMAIGGSKKNVRYLFNSETIIIGLISSIIGIIFTIILSKIINIYVYSAVGIEKLSSFTVFYALFVTVLTIFLNFISGLYPAIKAAKKNPARILRVE